jgi:hypothetical protein
MRDYVLVNSESRASGILVFSMEKKMDVIVVESVIESGIHRVAAYEPHFCFVCHG